MTNNETDQKMIRGLLIKPSGHIEDIELSGDTSQHVDQLRGWVSGGDGTPVQYFELLPVDRRCETMVFICDVGRINGMAINMPATMWLNQTGRYPDFICGPVVIFGYNEDDPSEVGDIPHQVKGEIPDFRRDGEADQWRVFTVEEFPKGT